MVRGSPSLRAPETKRLAQRNALRRLSHKRELRRGRRSGGRGRRVKRAAAESSSPPPAVEKKTDYPASPQKNNGSNDTDSSACSSPLRRTKSLLLQKIDSNGYEYNSYQEAADLYHKDLEKYKKKLALLQQLPVLGPCNYATNITDWYNLKEKNAVLDLAESVLSLSSSTAHGEREINSCSGIIIRWDERDNSTIVITSSQIIATMISLDDWEDNNVYDINAIRL